MPLIIHGRGYPSSDISTNRPQRIYSFKVWENGTLVRDMIPVRVGSTGAMYDKITKQVYNNVRGSGEFLPGPDK